MENTTRLLERHADTLAQRRWVLVDADDAAALRLPSLHHGHSDRPIAGASDVAMLPTLSGQPDLMVLVLPKSGERLAFLLAALAGQIQEDTEVWLVGPTRGGIKGGITRLGAMAEAVRVLDSARHCKLVSAMLRPAPFDLAAWRRQFVVPALQGAPLTVSSYPGVFNHGGLDDGTALLLQTLADAGLSGSVLDMGCGAGVISAVLARAGCRMTALDISATAVAACKETLADNGLEGRVEQSDLYQALPPDSRFNHLVTNPPFHDGAERTLAITRRLIDQAPRYLNADGSLWLVANQGLAYQDWLADSFAAVDVVAETSRFRVYRARR